MPEMRKTGPNGIEAVVMVMKVLEYMASQREAVGVTMLARTLGTSKSRIFRYLRTLVQLGYIKQAEETDRYRIGAKFIALGRTVGESFDLLSVARGIMHDLRDTLGHTTVLACLQSEGLRVVFSVPGNAIYATGVKHGALLNFHSTAQGKVALAFGPDELRARIFRSRLSMDTPKTIIDVNKLSQELKEIRRQGWAVSPDEALLGVNALAAPIFDATNAFVATAAIIDSIQFIPAQPTEEQIDQVMGAASQISWALGYISDETDQH